MDFTKGIRASLIEEGQPVAGRVGGEDVLLVRHEGEVYAISATCTHHGAPLKDGLVTEGEIRCPWHHACFSLRTGDATAPPAFNPLLRWDVEQRGDTVFVRGKSHGRDPLTVRSQPESKLRTIVIIGAGAAGSAAAEALRIHGFKGMITMVDPDVDAPYDRPNLSKDYLAGTAPDEWLPLRTQEFYMQHGIRRIVDAVVAIETNERKVTFEKGGDLYYDALLLATGSRPIRPSLPGIDLPHVHVLRTWEDCRRLMHATHHGTPVVIAGASFIAMETAAALRQRGAVVDVVAPELIPFAQVLGSTLGAALMKLHEQHGVRFHMGKKLQAVGEGHVVLDDGTSIAADVVLLGIGVRPDLSLAESAGIAAVGGVLANEYLETSAPGVYAAGDIARYPYRGQHVRIEHWVVAQRQGQAAARNMLGHQVPFTAIPFFWTQQYDISVSYVGHATDFTHITVDGDPASGDFAARFMNDDDMLAYVSIGRDYESLQVEKEMHVELQER